MLLRQIERVQKAVLIDRLIIACGNDPADDPLYELCGKVGLISFRGHPDDVLDRLYRAAAEHSPEHVVRLTSDCPLIDPQLIDMIIQFHIECGFDYTSNTINPTFPDGLDVEICRFDALKEAWKRATLPSEREHVTPFIHQNPERFNLGSFENSLDNSSLRWTVDEPDDFELVSLIYEELYPRNPGFTTADIMELLVRNPRLAALNACHQRNDGYRKSLENDRALVTKRS